MRKTRTILTVGLATLALVVMASVPALAMATTVNAVVTPLASVATTPAPVVHPSKRAIRIYRAKARVRLAAFNRDATVLRRHIDRLSTIATLAHKAGGDVAKVRAELTSARDYLAQARQQAIIAAADLRLVPYSANRKVALDKANDKFKSARSTLLSARNSKKHAATDLWSLIKQLRLTSKVSVRDFA